MSKKPTASTTTEKTWEHLGITIRFSPDGAQFIAEAAGKTLRAPSLDAIKAKIDKLNIGSFEPFDAYIEFGGYGTPPSSTIISKFEHFDSSRRGQYAYLCKVRVVALDTSEGKKRFRYELPGENDPRAKVQRSHDNELDDVLPAGEKTVQLWRMKCQALFDKEKAEHDASEVYTAAREAFDALEIKASTFQAVKS